MRKQIREKAQNRCAMLNEAKARLSSTPAKKG